MKYGGMYDLSEAVHELALKYDTTDRRVLQAISSQVETVEELQSLDFKSLDAIVQEGLVEVREGIKLNYW